MRDDRRAVLWVLLAALAAHWLTMGRYGFHRDELYLIVSGRHLGEAGVNHPTPAVLLARAAELLCGLSPFAQRFADSICGALTVLLAGACARRLGGGRPAQLIAALAVATGPIFFFSAGVHGTNAPDQLLWTLAGWVFLGFFDPAPPLPAIAAKPRWALLGATIALGVLTKATMLLCALGLFAALLLTPLRVRLRTPGPWICALVAVVLLLPSVFWQQRHGWPLFEFIASSNAAVRGRTPELAILFDQARLLHPVGFALATIGVAAGLRKGATAGLRAAALATLTMFAAVLALHGKPYYAASGAPLAIAAGSVACQRWVSLLSSRGARGLLAAWLLSAAVSLAGTLPLLPASVQRKLELQRLNPELVQFADWSGLVAEIGEAWRRADLAATPGAAVLTDSYGTAAALELYGPAHGLPAAICASNDFYFWSAGRDPPAVLALGYSASLLEELFSQVTAVATIRGTDGEDNRFDFPKVAKACRGRKRALGEYWQRMKRFD